MVEIFTLAHGANQTPVRAVSNEVRLSGTSDVYFGQTVAGIAYFEKSGADLKVTLLDGQEVMVRDFFVVGAAGDYSRLLLGAGGAVEVTGLIAPEPFMPPSEDPKVVEELVEPKTDAEAKPVEETHKVLTVETIEHDQSTDASAQTDSATATESHASAEGANAGAAAPEYFGIGLDKLLFAAVQIPIMFQLGQDKDEAPTSTVVSDTNSANDGSEGTGMSPADAALVNAIVAGEAMDTTVADADSSDGFTTSNQNVLDSAEITALFEPLHSLFDDLTDVPTVV